jgi:succinate-semialdehyde dehydrogenase/glutarate-semialdehyde dehydrogenase
VNAIEKIETRIADALNTGAKVVIGGKCSALGCSFYEPTVLTGLTADMMITRGETFDPGVVIGPLIGMKVVERVEAHLPD